MAIVSDVEIRLRADIARLQQDLNRARQEVNGALGGMSQAVEKFKSLLGGLAIGAVLTDLAHQAVQAQREFDKLNSSLVTATGSTENAAQAFAALQKFAASTPYDLKQTTEAFLQLRNLGLTPSERALRSYGNTAAAMGKNLSQLVEAVADAAGGEFERLKEFGIKSKQEGDKVAFTFQGTTTKIKNNADEIEKYLIALGETQFAGGMERQAQTLDGAISGLGDTWQGVLRTFSQGGFGDAVRSGVIQLSEALSDFTDYFAAASGAAKKNGEEIDKLGPLYQGITLILRQAVIIGAQMSFVFTTLGRSIGAGLAALNEIGKGEVTNAINIVTQRWSELPVEWAEVNKRIEDIDKAASDRRRIESIQAVTSWGDELERYKIKADKQQEMSDADKKAAAEALAFYTKTREASIDQLMVLEQERDGQAAMSAEEKKRVEILNDLLKYGKSLTAQQRADIQGWAEAIPVLAKYNKFLEESRKLRTAREGDAQSDVAAANAQTQALQDQITYYGLTEQAVLKLKAAEIQRGIDSGYIDDLERERLQGLLAATNEQIVAQTKLSKMKAESTFWSGLEDTARQTFLSIANGSKDTATRLKETFKNIFFDWLYQMTVKKWIINIGTSVSGTAGVSGIANAAGIGGTGSSTLDLLSMGKTIYQGFTSGFSGIGASVGGYVAALGNTFGSASVSAFGAGMGLTGSQAASAAAAYNAAGMAGTGSAISAGSVAGATLGELSGIAGGIYGGRLISGGYSAFGGSGNSAVNTGTAVGAVVGSIIPVLGTALGGLIGGLLGGVSNRLFGYKSPQIESQGIRGSIGASGIDAETYATILQKGGWFRSDKRTPQKAALEAQVDSALDTTIKTMISSVKDFGKAMGLEASAIDSYTKIFDLKLTGDAAKDEQALLGLLNTVGDELSARLVPGLEKFALQGEALSPTLQRIATDYVAVDAAFKAIGKSISQVGVIGIEVREQLIKAAGGLEQLATGISYFQQNFIPEAERAAQAQKEVTEAMTALGYSGVTTTAQFKDLVQGLDVSTKAGAELFTKLLALAPVFKEVSDATDAARKAAIAALGQAATDALTALGTALDKQKAELAKSLASALDVVGKSIDAMSPKVDNLRDLSELLSSPVVSANTPGQQRDRQAAARADIMAALAIAKASGVLPSADSLRDAVSAATSASTEGFGDMVSYLREQAAVGRDLAQLGDMTNGQLSVAEKTLQALNDQKTAIQAGYDAEVVRLDALLVTNKEMLAAAQGNATINLSVAAALSQVATAIGALAIANGQPAAAIESLYQSVLGRQSESAGMVYWLGKLKEGDTLDSIREAFFKSPEYLGQQAAQAAESPLVIELRAINARMAAVEANTLATSQAASSSASSNAQLAQQFDQVSAGGGALLTEPVQ